MLEDEGKFISIFSSKDNLTRKDNALFVVVIIK